MGKRKIYFCEEETIYPWVSYANERTRGGAPHLRATARVPSTPPHSPALTKIRGSDESHRIFVRAGVGLTRGGDPCGPYTGRFFKQPFSLCPCPCDGPPCVCA